MIYPCCKWCH